jgi:hypothetical protein
MIVKICVPAVVGLKSPKPTVVSVTTEKDAQTAMASA